MLNRHRPFRATSLALTTAVAIIGGCHTPSPSPKEPASSRSCPSYSCHRAEDCPVLDGDLSDPCWSAAEKAVVQWPSGGTGERKAPPADFRLLWDDVYLYFAAEVRNAAPHPKGAVRDDPVWEGDCIELTLNPAHRRGEYYEMDFSPAGVIWDSLWLCRPSGDSRTLRSWTAPSLECRTLACSSGWTLEGRVRLDEFLASGRMPPADGETWRLNVNYLEASAQGLQAVFSWSPTPELGSTEHFGMLRFVDPRTMKDVQLQREMAQRHLGELREANSLAARLDEVTVRSKTGLPFKSTGDGKGWTLPGTFGRFTVRPPKPGEPPAMVRAQPARGDDPTVIDFAAWAEGTLLVMGKLDRSGPSLLEKGDADGVWLYVDADGVRRATLRLISQDWQAERLAVRKGQALRLTVSAGPAANAVGDISAVGIYLLPTNADGPAAQPAAWEIFGEAARVRTEGAVWRLQAGDAFTGVHQWLPRSPENRLYRITGRVRTDLVDVSRAHVGLDYYTADKTFIRQASTRAPLDVHLRWGLYNASGRTAWHRFAAYAYHVPAKAAWLRLWCGVNAWETPGASGAAWFEDVRIEAVDPDPAWPLGFPPARWQPERGPVWSPEAEQSGYVVSAISYLEYVLPERTPARGIDDRRIGAFALPGWKEPISFTVHALRDLQGVKIDVTDLRKTDPQPAVIPADRVAVRQVRAIYKKRDLLMGNEYLLSPNHLEPFDSVDVPANRTQQFWLTVDVPADAPAGRYAAELRITPAGAPAKALHVDLEVLPVRTVPPRALIAGMYSYFGPEDTKPAILRDFRDMRDHGMTTTFAFHPGLRIPVEKAPDGQVRIQWNEANQLCDLMDAYCEAAFPAPLHLLTPTAFFEAAELYGGPCGSDAFAAVYRSLWSQVVAEKRARDWPDFVVAPYDEGYPYTFTEERFRRMRALTPPLSALGIPVATHAVNHPTPQAVAFEREFYPALNEILLTFCHPPVTVTESYRGFANWNAYCSRVQGDGKKLLYYNPDCTGVHPEAMRFVYGVGLWNRKADGVMDWHYRELPRDGGYGVSPVQGSAVLSFTFATAGEFRGGPTLGWEAAREGVKDYTLLHTLRTLVERAEASPAPDVRAMGAQAAREVDAFLNRLTFATMDTTGALSLPARFEHESWSDDWAHVLGGDFKVPNGFVIEDYDRLRRLVFEHILRLSGAMP